ncbi:hypothetical protein B0H34DRAFT_254596 [Crassisporium funariophilum]|nr:hypothetical protein B0H34DRAFT_254596 [Crassisporium funariophilum]
MKTRQGCGEINDNASYSCPSNHLLPKRRHCEFDRTSLPPRSSILYPNMLLAKGTSGSRPRLALLYRTVDSLSPPRRLLHSLYCLGGESTSTVQARSEQDKQGQALSLVLVGILNRYDMHTMNERMNLNHGDTIDLRTWMCTTKVPLDFASVVLTHHLSRQVVETLSGIVEIVRTVWEE